MEAVREAANTAAELEDVGRYRKLCSTDKKLCPQPILLQFNTRQGKGEVVSVC